METTAKEMLGKYTLVNSFAIKASMYKNGGK